MNEDPGLLTCGQCGVVITSESEPKHAEWHKSLDKLLVVLSEAAKASATHVREPHGIWTAG